MNFQVHLEVHILTTEFELNIIFHNINNKKRKFILKSYHLNIYLL
jgi:hypothetical protein